MRRAGHDARMIDLYTSTTPNGQKIPIALEELGLPYKVHHLDLQKDDQHKPEFLAINPNGKIPAIVDREGPTTVFESGAILIYLAEKTGKLLPPSGPERYETLAWLMFQVGGVGPMFGQLGHFTLYSKEKVPYAIERYTNEADRLLGVLDARLGEVEYLARSYSIADIATYPWVASVVQRMPKEKSFVHVNAWLERMGSRPAVQKGMKIG